MKTCRYPSAAIIRTCWSPYPASHPRRISIPSRPIPSRGLTFNVNGTTRNSNDVRIDGALANNVWLPHVTAYVPALDSIEAVTVVTASADASEGMAGGSAVNVQIKSGTNQIHGSLFEFHADNAMKAKPFFLPTGQGKPKYIDNQFGGSIGGPILQQQALLLRKLGRHL